MTKVASIHNSYERTCEQHGELSRRELLVLKEIQLTGYTANRTLVLQLFNDDLIVDFRDGRMQLTAKGRRMLMRGSPSLWDISC